MEETVSDEKAVPLFEEAANRFLEVTATGKTGASSTRQPSALAAGAATVGAPAVCPFQGSARHAKGLRLQA